MRLRLLIAAQAGVILGLIGLVVFQARQLRLAHEELADIPLPLADLPTSTNQRPVRLRLQQIPSELTRPRYRDLDWRSVESADYATYVANLRRIGCPEETIRDILLADIDQLFESRRRALQPPPRDWDFWRNPADRGLESSDAGGLSEQERQVALAHLRRERRQLITALLGPSALQTELAEFKDEELRDRSLQFLSEEKRQAVADALARWRQAREEASTLAGDAERQETMRLAGQTLDAVLDAVLTKDERLQYEMRTSPLADELRERLRGFGASREEFEQLYALERDLAERRAAIAANPDDPQMAERLEAAEMEHEQAVHEVLDPQRYGDFQRSADPDYQTLYTLALDHEVPTAVANQVWDMRRAVADQANLIRENPLLTADQKQRALEAIRQETQNAIVNVLGEPLLLDYQRQGGEWLYQLTDPIGLAEVSPALDLTPALGPEPEQVPALPLPPAPVGP